MSNQDLIVRSWKRLEIALSHDIYGPASRSCQDCKSPLYILPQDQKNYMCLECGQKYPIEQQQTKGKLSTIYESSSNSIGVVQPQNYQGRKPRSLRERSPLEEELTAKG